MSIMLKTWKDLPLSNIYGTKKKKKKAEKQSLNQMCSLGSAISSFGFNKLSNTKYWLSSL